jgi:MazG family protein
MSGEKFEGLLALMARLRAPGGCPWDREQTLETLRPYLIEEAYEALDAIEREDWAHLPEELGDVLLQVVFQAQIAREASLFTIDDVVDAISQKLVRRHPHVFGEESIDTAGRVVKRWEEIKAEEKAAKQEGEASILDGTPRHQPALLEAFDMGKRAARKGFDWSSYEDLIAKLHEEAEELAAERESGDRDALEDEVGDLLFMAVNIARFLEVNPELALKRANRKFRERFGYIERELRAQGRTLEESSLEEMEQLWQRAKSA